MIHVRLTLAILLVLGVASGTFAAPVVYEWGTQDWDTSTCPCTYTKFNPVYDEACDWTYGVGPDSALEQMGSVPENDPLVSQLFLNSTSGYWSDWHLDISNNCKIIAGSIKVYNYSDPGSPTVYWSIPTLRYNGSNIVGFDAETVVGSGREILPGEKIKIEWIYQVVGTGQVVITQYPTNTAPIPEPSVLVALATGLAGLGFGIRRRG